MAAEVGEVIFQGGEMDGKPALLVKFIRPGGRLITGEVFFTEVETLDNFIEMLIQNRDRTWGGTFERKELPPDMVQEVPLTEEV